MSPEVAGLSYCKKLAVLLPKAKTEYYWGYYEDEGEIVAISQREIILNGSQYFHIICPAWQIHELLKMFDNLVVDQGIDDNGYYVWTAGNADTQRDVRLVDALIKLTIWRKEND